jgi:hypothetical protein
MSLYDSPRQNGTPTGDRGLKKIQNLPSRRASERPEAGVLHIENEFHDSIEKQIDSYLFLQSLPIIV